MDPLASLDRSTLRERALEALRAAITSGQYRPGDHLGEVELAKNLGVSRGTVREALRHLQQEGLVTAGNRGMLRVNSLKSGGDPGAVPGAGGARGARRLDHIIASPDPPVGRFRLRSALTELAERRRLLRRGSSRTSISTCCCVAWPGTPCSSTHGATWRAASELRS